MPDPAGPTEVRSQALSDPAEQAELERLFRLLRRTGEALRPTVPIAQRRAVLAGWQPPLAPDVVAAAVLARGVPCEWIETPGAGPTTVLYVHGGGYTLGGLGEMRDFLSRISRACRARILHPDYRLAPEHPFPAALDDVHATYTYLIEAVDPARIVLVGDSAGGGLALSLAMRLRDNGVALPAALVLMSPWADLAMTGASYRERAERDPVETAELLEWSARAYAAGVFLDHPYLSPLHGDFDGLPAMMVLVGTEEMMYDDAVGIAVKARSANIDVTLDIAPGMPHVYPRFADTLAAGRRAITRIAHFVETAMPGPPSTAER